MGTPEKKNKTCTTLFRVKKICILVLLLSFFLPLARSCSRIEIHDKIQGFHISWTAKTVKNSELNYIWDVYSFDAMTGWDVFCLMVAYAWPLPFVLSTRSKKPSLSYLKSSFECLIASIGIYFFITPLSFLGELLVGSYIYLLAAGAYITAVLLQVWCRIKEQLLQRKTRRRLYSFQKE